MTCVFRGGNEVVTSWHHESAANICLFQKGELHRIRYGISNSFQCCDWFVSLVDIEINSRMLC